MTVTVIVDSREKADIKKYLYVKGVKFKTAALTTGDYLFYDDKHPDIRVLVERKNIGDLISSLYDGRIEKQFKRMSEEEFPILLVTGTVKDLSKHIPFKVEQDAVEKVLSDAVVRYGFRSVIWIVNGFKDPKKEGLLFVTQLLKNLVNGNLDNIPAKKAIRKTDPRLDIIKLLFNVKITVAESLLKTFGSTRSIINATDSQLIKIEGVGVTTVKRIRMILDDNINEKKGSVDYCERCGKKKSVIPIKGKTIRVCIGCKKR